MYKRQVFKHDSRWSYFINKSQSFGEKVALIVLSKLFARFGKRWTGHAACQEIDTLEAFATKRAHIAFYNQPPRAIKTQGIATRSLDFNESFVPISCFLKTERLSAGPSANFHT